MIYTGSCLCGDVSFEVNGEFESFFLCHCKYCQKDTGSAHASNLFLSTAKLSWRTGEEKVCTYQLPSTRHMKSFCSHCGSAVPSIQINNKLVVVPAGCLNQDITIKPTAHIYKSSAAVWEKDIDKVKTYKLLPK